MDIKRSFDAVRTISEALFFRDYIYSHEAMSPIYSINSYAPSSVNVIANSTPGIELHRVWLRRTAEEENRRVTGNKATFFPWEGKILSPRDVRFYVLWV